MEVGSVSFGIRFNENSIDQALQELRNKFSREDLTIRPQTDERALVGLNKHLDVKKRHLSDVIDFYERNPITPTFKEMSKSQINQLVRDIESQIEIHPVIQVEAKQQQQQSQIVQQEASQTFRTKEELDPLKSIASGAFEEIGSAFSKRFTGTFIKSIEDKVGFTVKDAGKYTGQFATHLWDTQFNKDTLARRQKLQLGMPIDPREPEPVYVSPSTAGKYTADFAVHMWDKFSGNSGDKSKEITQKIQQESKQVNTGIANLFKKNIDNSVAVINTEIKKNTGDISNAKAQFEQIKQGFSSAYKQMNEYLKKGDIQLAEAHAKVIVEMSERAKGEIDKIKTTLKSQGIKTGFGTELSNYAGSTKGTIERSYSKPAQRALSKIENDKLTTQTAEIGVQTIQGLALGLSDSDIVSRESSEIAFTILNAMRKTLGIQSPSKEGAWIGKQFILGLVQGIEKGGKLIDVAADKIALRITKAFTAKMPKLPTEEGIIPDGDTSAEEQEKELRKRNRVRHLNLRNDTRLQRQFIKAGFIPQNSDEWQEFNPGSREYFDLQFNRFGQRFQRDVGGRFAKQAAQHGETVSPASITREIAGAIASAGILAAPAQMGMAALSPLALPMAPTGITAMLVSNLLAPIIGQIGKSLQTVEPILNKYTAIAGSKEQGANELNYVRGVTSTYNVGLEGASDQYAALSSAAKGTKLEGDGVRELFEGISASARAMNLSTYDSTLVFNAYTQILGKGKLSMEELRQQLSEKFPPAMSVFAEALGVTVPELNTLISKGAVLSEDVLPKVAKALQSRFGDAAKNAANSFSGSIAKLENAKFDIGAKFVDGFGGAFAAVNNATANMLQMIADNWKQIQTVLTTLLIGLSAQVAVALEMIFSSPQISKVTGVMQNFLQSAFSKSFYVLTPFLAGLFVDLFDDAIGSQRNIIQNMSQGIGNLFTGIASEIDHVSRLMNNTSLFSPKFEDKEAKGFLSGITEQLDKINLLGVSIGDLTRSFGELFKGLLPGVGEFVALIVMFEQLAILGAHYTKPTFEKIGAAAIDMGKGIFKAVTSFENITLSFKNFIAVTLNQTNKLFGQMLAKLAFFAAEASIAIGVMMLAQSDFSDPLATELNKNSKKIIDDVGGIEKSLQELKNVGVDTAKQIGKAFGEMNLADKLPSKGLELNLKKVFGLEDESKSYKTDDLLKDLNNNTGDNWLLKFIRLFPSDPGVEGQTMKDYREKASKVGVGDFFKEGTYVTTGQKQLYNKAFDLNEFNTQLNKRLAASNLTPDTVGNFASGQVGEQIKKIQQYDKILEQLGNKRVEFALIDDTDSKEQVRAIDKDIKKVLADRKQLQKPLGQSFDFLYDTQKQIDEKIKAVQNSDLPFEARKALLAPLEEQKKAIDDTVNYIKSSGLAKVAEPLQEIWTGVISKLRDADGLFEKLTNRQKIEDLNTQASIYSKNLSTEQTKAQIDSSTVGSLQNTQQALESILETRKRALERILSISEIETNDERKKEVAELRKSIVTDTTNLAQTKQQIAQAQNEMFNKLKEQSKSVQEYFDSVSNAAKEKDIEFKKLQNTLKAETQQSKIRAILTDGFDTIISQFLDSVSSIIEKENERANKQLDVEAAALKSKQDLKSTLKQGDEILKSLVDDGIELTLDTSSLKNDVNVQALNNELGKATDQLGMFSTKLPFVKSGFDDNTKSVKELYQELSRIPSLLDATKDKLAGNNVVVKEWNTSLNDTAGILGNIQNGLTGIGEAINNNVASTTAWVGALSSGSDLMGVALQNAGNIGNTLTNIGTSDPQNNPNVFGQLGNLFNKAAIGNLNKNPIQTTPYRAVESISGRLITAGRGSSDIEIHHPSRGNHGREAGRDYEMVDGRLEEVQRSKAGLLIKKDMVLSRNGSTNVPIASPATGVVSSVNAGMGKVNISDLAGNLISQILHLKDIKVKQGDMVQYGQSLGIQGGVGAKGANTYATHLHASMTKEMWSNYIRDMNDGGFDTNTVNCTLCGGKNHNKVQHQQVADQNFTQAVTGGGKSGFIGKIPAIIARATGKASFYTEKSNTGTGTANGEHYDETGMTTAVPTTQRHLLNTIIKVTNQATGKSTFVRANDTGGFGAKQFGRRLLDLSRGAAKQIGITESQGVGNILAEYTGQKVPKGKAGDAIVAQLNAQLQKSGSGRSIDMTITNKMLTQLRQQQGLTQPGKYKAPDFVKDTLKQQGMLDTKTEKTFSTKQPFTTSTTVRANLRGKVKTAQDIAKQSSAQEQERIKAQTALEDKRLADEIKRERNKAMNSLEDYSRELGISYKTSARGVEDSQYNAIAFPKVADRKTKEITDTKRQFQDNRDSIEKTLRDLEKPIDQAKKMLSTVDLPADMKASVQKALAEMIDKENKYKLLLKKNNELELDNIAAIEKRYDREQTLKTQREKIEDEQQSLNTLQKEIDYLEQLKNISPYDKQLQDLPRLKEQASLLENSIQYQQQLNELEEQDFNELGAGSYKKRLDYLNQQNEARIDAIKLVRQQSEKEQELERVRRKQEQTTRFLNLDNQLKKNLSRRPDVQYDVAVSEARNALDSAYLEINERKYENPLDALRERSKNSQIFLANRQQAELTRQSSNIQLNQDSYDFFTQPVFDSASKRAEKMRNYGQEFRGNALNREIATTQENFRYRQQLLEIETKIQEKRAAGETIAEDQVSKLKQSLEEIHNFNLEDVQNQFKSFGKTVDEVTKQAIGGLGNSIADLVVDGGDLGETLNGIFKQVLKGFISTGINSLVSPILSGNQSPISSLFGGGSGGMFGGLLGGIGKIFGFSSGGIVPGYAGGGDIRNSNTPIGLAMRAEGSNSVLATLTPNERVLTVQEARVYNTLFPNGILNSVRPANFNDGGMVDPTPISQKISNQSINVGVTANVEDSGGSMKEKQLVSLIRAVVTAELNRQKSPGGILSN